MPRPISLPTKLPLGFDQLLVHGHLSVPKETGSEFREFFKEKEDDLYVRLTESLEIDDRSCLLHATLGVHPEEERCNVHYSVALDDFGKADDEVEEEEQTDWEPLARTLDNLPAHDVLSALTLFLETALVKTTVELPIKISYPGMTQISGIRLSEPDPENPDRHLRSVVLDQLGNRTLLIGTIMEQLAPNRQLLMSNYDALQELTSKAYETVDGS